ncbi:MAG: TetR/AcrR family transcriptional regulator [Spirochaetales bacterium]|nr:TetR/AcrR family transcriptional regulator [Spirochaetales bacterium]
MQIKKNDVRETIIKAAEKEFCEKGFKDASLRRIASEAGVTKGNIYTYFESKDRLFCELVQPALDFIAERMNSEDFVDEYGDETRYTEKDAVDNMRFYVEGLSEHKEALKLLLFSSAGSSLAGYREEVFHLYTESTKDFFRKFNRQHPEFSFKISEMLIHSYASLFLSFIEEIIVHDPSEDELDMYINQIARFVYHGNMGVLRGEPEKEIE